MLLAGVAAAGLIVGYLVGSARSGVDLGPGAVPERTESTAVEPAEAPSGPAGPAPAVEPPAQSTGQVATKTAPAPLYEDFSEAPGAESLGPEARAESEPLDLGPMPEGDGARLAVVIDDLGRRVQDVVELSEFGVPLSFSVLPFESRTAEVVQELERSDQSVKAYLSPAFRIKDCYKAKEGGRNRVETRILS